MRRALVRATRESRFERLVERYDAFFTSLKFHRGGGIAATVLIIAASIGYGVVKGGHVAEITSAFSNLRDMAANTAGFRIASIAFAGNRHITRDEILARAGVTGTSSLLFLDVSDARAKLMADPRVADATLLKLYPDRLQVTITERKPFALWQFNGRVSVIADDGSVLEPYVSQPFVDLPLFVGKGAEARAKEFLALLDQYPDVRANVTASVLVAERRWNLRLKNGLDVKLPESDAAQAIQKLASLDRTYQLTGRDITAIDLRMPDRITVRLSDEAAQVREAAAKEKLKPKKGGNV